MLINGRQVSLGDCLREVLKNSVQGEIEKSSNLLSTYYVWGILLHLEYVRCIKQAHLLDLFVFRGRKKCMNK